MKFKRKMLTICLLACLALTLSGCGKKNDKITYEIVDGQIVEIVPDGYLQSAPTPVPATAAPVPTPQTEAADASHNASNEIDNYIPESEDQTGVNPGEEAYDGKDDTEGTAVTAVASSEEYNSIASESDTRIKVLEKDFEAAVNSCSQIYEDADKGQGINVSLSSSTVAQLITAIGNVGYAAIDSNNEFNMQNYEAMHQFGLSVRGSENTSGTYFVVYPDGHMSAYQLYRESGKWHLLAMSSGIDEFRIYQDSKGRYAISEVRYTDNGWLIYKRDGNTKYSMIRVLPLESYARQLCEKYVEPIGYLENNLFTTTWSETNMGPIDFNSLYAYLFGMYNGTQMLSSYNVRNYYKAYGGTRIYIVPTDTFETVVQTYFSIDPSVLKSISDYSAGLGGYMFLGYNRDYYNVPPKTPSPEVVKYESNADGSLTLTVNAVSDWYGTDRAFQHKLTVFPGSSGFKYVSNELIYDENNIIPEAKLSEMLNVERAKSVY